QEGDREALTHDGPDHGQRQQTADVVLYWMQRRGMTRKLFADRMGTSLSWVDKIKTGDRQLDRLSVLRRIAEVLDIPLAVLIDPEEAQRRQVCPDDHEIDAVRDALHRYDVMTNIFRPNGHTLPEPALVRLERTVSYGWIAFQAVNYQAVGQLLADLIRDAQAAVGQLDGDERRSAQAWLSWTYQLTASTAFKPGDAQLGWLAADRAIQVAEQTGDQTLTASAAMRVAHALMVTHQSPDAVGLVRSAANRLEPHLAGGRPGVHLRLRHAATQGQYRGGPAAPVGRCAGPAGRGAAGRRAARSGPQRQLVGLRCDQRADPPRLGAGRHVQRRPGDRGLARAVGVTV
ncbi:MAG TPA: helix-turn-helix domain-containing protein, partial [Pseudonocardiaceae bacterium]|nr:helix-turn-helix domain-containing protein [Pseudonocardiaceae bacterium]